MSALAHPVSWQAPRPLWRGTTRFAAAPQILRFASDDFMEQLVATLEEEPARLSDRIAKPETWRDPPQGVDLVDPIVRLPLPAPIKDAKRKAAVGISAGRAARPCSGEQAAETLSARASALLCGRGDAGLRDPRPA